MPRLNFVFILIHHHIAQKLKCTLFQENAPYKVVIHWPFGSNFPVEYRWSEARDEYSNPMIVIKHKYIPALVQIIINSYILWFLRLLIMSAACFQMHSRNFYQGSKHYEPWSDWEQSDLGP